MSVAVAVAAAAAVDQLYEWDAQIIASDMSDAVLSF